MIFYYFIKFLKYTAYFYFYFFIFLMSLCIFDFIYIIFLELYYYLQDNLTYIYLKNKVINCNLKRFLNNDVIIFTKNNIKLIGSLKNIYEFKDFYNVKKIYFLIEIKINFSKYEINENIYINFDYMKSIEYIIDKKSRYLLNFVKNNSDNKLPFDIFKVIEDYI